MSDKSGFDSKMLAELGGISKRMVDYIFARQRGGGRQTTASLSAVFGLNYAEMLFIGQLILEGVPGEEALELAKAGVKKHVYQHLLRHSFGTTATMAGLPSATVQDIMGHSDPETTKIYINFAEKQLFELGARFKKIVEEDVAHMDDTCK